MSLCSIGDAFRHLGQHLDEHLFLLEHVWSFGYRPCNNLLGAEIIDWRKISLAPWLRELGHIGAEFLPWTFCREFPVDDVPGKPADNLYATMRLRRIVHIRQASRIIFNTVFLEI